MRNAPSVIYPVGRSAFHGWLLLSLGLAGVLAGTLWWCLSATPHGWMAAVGGVSWLAWSLSALRHWWNTPRGRLAWRAAAAEISEPGRRGLWCWTDEEGAEHALDVVQRLLDAQSVLLVRLSGPALSVRWLWLSRRSDPARWDALRRALVAHAA